MPEIRTKIYRACILFSDFVRLSVSIFIFGYVMFVSQILRNVSESFVVHIWLLTQPPPPPIMPRTSTTYLSSERTMNTQRTHPMNCEIIHLQRSHVVFYIAVNLHCKLHATLVKVNHALCQASCPYVTTGHI